MLEKTIENRLKNKVKKMGGRAIKFNATNFAGMPDRLILLPGGKIYFIELKSPGKKPRLLQLSAHRFLKSMGMNVRTIDSPEGVDSFLREVTFSDIQST